MAQPNMQDTLPSGVFLRCLMGAGIWRLDVMDPEAIRAKEARTGWRACQACGGQGFDIEIGGINPTIGPWFVSRGWRDAFWSGATEGWLWEVWDIITV